ncbi:MULTISPECIES: isochorismatase family cysteine hydrolase [unclassified Streptomyces]|uniref:isochorismatase family cysteine hydrolase n=1 Tax=unclassified Streptomyces TaxID=2593676 RepID=UPI00037B212F|nr:MULTISPECIES: isochorismatase family cysteine hydrolase [unclassified Streptomyces]MYQ79900.1 isochorismatase family protein [Streptomyces sp. SID4923]
MHTDSAMHEWQIEPREYARQEARRGRRHAYTSLDPARTALIVIDMVPFFVEANPYVRGIVQNIGRIAESLRTAGGLVAWVLPANEAPLGRVSGEFYGPVVSQTFAATGGEGLPRTRVWHAFDEQPDDLVVEKSAYSAFFPGRCLLPELLAERGTDTVVITGALTNVCCESSARDAATAGLRVLMVADANAARRDQDHNATLHTIYRSFGDVRSTNEVLDLIGRSTPSYP